MSKVEVNAKGIKNRLKAFKPFSAIGEYVWNGFDANATEVSIDYKSDALGAIIELSISDNGSGIPYDSLHSKFTPLLSSEKREHETQQSLTHGKNGLGRLTFYHFCQSATWKTIFSKEENLHQYSINVNQDNIDHYIPSELEKSEKENTGTTVYFKGIFDLSEHIIENSISNFLIKEFAWFLEFKKDVGCLIKINGKVLDISPLVKDSEEFEINIKNNYFNVRFFRWAEKLNKHCSRFYGADSEGNYKYSKPTTFNNKGDSFYHSVFIKSDFFDNFKCELLDGQEDCIT